MPESQHYKHSKSNASEIVDSFRASGRSSIVGHKRAASNPEKLTQAAYLDDSEYGIRLVGRTSSEEEALLTTSMISKARPGQARGVTNQRNVGGPPSPRHTYNLDRPRSSDCNKGRISHRSLRMKRGWSRQRRYTMRRGQILSSRWNLFERPEVHSGQQFQMVIVLQKSYRSIEIGLTVKNKKQKMIRTCAR